MAIYVAGSRGTLFIRNLGSSSVGFILLAERECDLGESIVTKFSKSLWAFGAMFGACAAMVACSNTEFQGANVSSRGRNLSALQVDDFGVTGDKRTKQATQGASGQQQSESFVQNASNPLDIVLVVDNSGSMLEEQANLASKLSALLSAVEATDWRIGITSTDLLDGGLVRLISKGDPNVKTTFSDAINGLGVNGSGHEMGIAQAMHAVRGGIEGRGGITKWIRKNSGLAVMIVSDEDNCSGEGGDYFCGPPRAGFSRGQLNQMLNKSYLLDYLQGERQFKKTTRIYGIINTPESNCSGLPLNTVSAIYADAIRTTGGLSGSICDSSYQKTLEEISKDFVAVLSADYTLADSPDAGSIKVTVNGVDFAGKFTVSGRTLSFQQVPPEGANISVSYTSGKSSGSGVIALSGERISNVEVKINGRKLSSNEFSFDASSAQVKVNAKLSSGDVVSVNYSTGAPRRSIQLSRTPKSVTDIKVYAGNPSERGSQQLSANQFSYDSKSNTVSISSSVAEPNTTFFVQYPAK